MRNEQTSIIVSSSTKIFITVFTYIVKCLLSIKKKHSIHNMLTKNEQVNVSVEDKLRKILTSDLKNVA